MTKKILLIEDNQDICQMLSEAFTKAGYSLTSSYSGTEGLDLFNKQKYDLVLLDIMLPHKSGDEVLCTIRNVSNVPIIIISAKDRVSTKIDFLKLGADDYITKPFDLNEVIARTEAHLRRYTVNNELLVYKNIALDKDAKRLFVKGREVELTATEIQLLVLLLENKNKVFTKANLYESIWGMDTIGDDNAIKTHISNLRSKLKSADPNIDYIETVWGLGYRLYRE